jgi:hypothetical protein
MLQYWLYLIDSRFSQPGMNPLNYISLPVFLMACLFNALDELIQSDRLVFEVLEVDFNAVSHYLSSHKMIHLP